MKITFPEKVELMDATNPQVGAKDVPSVEISAGTYECERVPSPFSPASGLMWIKINVPGDTRVLGKSEATLSKKGKIEE